MWPPALPFGPVPGFPGPGSGKRKSNGALSLGVKANRRFVDGDEAVSPVVAVILMVAITVVLAASVYLWTSGFRGDTSSTASQFLFAVKSADLPSITGGPAGDADSSDDALELTFVSGARDLQSSEIALALDGQQLTGQASGAFGFRDAASTWCTSLPVGATMSSGFTWTRGASLYLWKAGATCASAASMKGTHLVQASAAQRIALDAEATVHDDLP